MSATQLVAQITVISVASWYLWYLVQKFLFKSGLDNIPGPPSNSVLRGVFPRLFNINAWDYHRSLWEKYEGVVRFKGPLNRNHLYVYDPKALHHILVKDQNIYQQESSITTIAALLGYNISSRQLLFGPGLLTTLGDHHKKQRKMLNPVFSIAHMRQMMPIFYNIVHKLEKSLSKQLQDGPKEIDMLSWMGRTALELISQSGFGYSFDDLEEEDYTESSYSVALKQIVPVTFKLLFARSFILPYIANLGSAAFRRKAINWIPIATLHESRDLVDIIHQTSLEIYQSKKKALMEGNENVAYQIAQGKDILSILMKANMEASDEDRLPDEEIYSQISTFTFAGTDTTSNALARTLWLLAQRKDVQDKLRAEIRGAADKAGGDIPYDELVALPYMDAICRETLRLYTPVLHLTRKPTEDIVLPLHRPIKGLDGAFMSEIHVPKGTKIHISLLATNRSKDIWGEDAEVWRPERWLEPMRDSVVNAKIPGIYSHLMSFSAGSRACIGFKFSQLEMKTVLSLLISRFDFSISQEIFWQMTNIVTPVIKNAKGGGLGSSPQLPLVVRRAT